MRESGWYTVPNPIPVDYDNTNIAPTANTELNSWQSAAVRRGTSPTNLDGHPELTDNGWRDYRHHADNDWFCEEVGRLCTQYTDEEWESW